MLMSGWPTAKLCVSNWRCRCWSSGCNCSGIVATAWRRRRGRPAICASPLSWGGEWLLTAHHQDDQLETLLLALKRGAGLRGLAGMVPSQPFAGGHLLRPLLEVSRAELAEVAASLPMAGWRMRATRMRVMTATSCANGSFPSSRPAGPPWPRRRHAAWRCAPSRRRCWRSWQRPTGGWRRQERRCRSRRCWPCQLPGATTCCVTGSAARGEMPSREQLGLLWQEVALAREDANPQLNWGTQSCRRFQGRLHLVRPGLQPRHEQLTLAVGRR